MALWWLAPPRLLISNCKWCQSPSFTSTSSKRERVESSPLCSPINTLPPRSYTSRQSGMVKREETAGGRLNQCSITEERKTPPTLWALCYMMNRKREGLQAFLHILQSELKPLIATHHRCNRSSHTSVTSSLEIVKWDDYQWQCCYRLNLILKIHLFGTWGGDCCPAPSGLTPMKKCVFNLSEFRLDQIKWP